MKPDSLTLECSLFVLSEFALSPTALVLLVVESAPFREEAKSAARLGTAPRCPERMQGMDVQGDVEEQDHEIVGVDAGRQENALPATTKPFSAYRTRGCGAGLPSSRDRLEPNAFANG